VRVATWYRLRPEEVELYFSPYDLRLLLIAEAEAPWGEAAANMRLRYTSYMRQAASDGYKTEDRQAAQSSAKQVWDKLAGVAPVTRKPFRVSDMQLG